MHFMQTTVILLFRFENAFHVENVDFKFIDSLQFPWGPRFVDQLVLCRFSNSLSRAVVLALFSSSLILKFLFLIVLIWNFCVTSSDLRWVSANLNDMLRSSWNPFRKRTQLWVFTISPNQLLQLDDQWSTTYYTSLQNLETRSIFSRESRFYTSLCRCWLLQMTCSSLRRLVCGAVC